MMKLESTRDALHGLADALDARRGALMEMWRDRVAADGTLDATSEWSLKQLNDHFPDVLEALLRALRTWPDQPTAQVGDEIDYAVAHARARWIQGYSLRGVIREWGHFNAVVTDQLLALAAEADDPGTLRVASSVWTRLLNDQQALSAREYHELERAEAETRGAELMRALEALRSGSSRRGRTLESLAATMRNDLQVVMTSNTLARDDGDAQAAFELRRLSHDSFRSLEQALCDLVTLAHLEAGHETPVYESFDAAQGLALLVEGLQHVAAANGTRLVAHGPDRLDVEGDAERVRRLAKHLAFCAMRAPTPEVVVKWSECEADGARWCLQVEHPVASTLRGDTHGAGHALAVATDAAQQVTGDVPTGNEAALGAGAIPIAEGDGVDLLIAKHLCDLLGGGLQIEAADGRLRYRASLPIHYRSNRHGMATPARAVAHDPMQFRH